MPPFVPSRIFLTRGVGRHREKLASFELALRDAGIAPCNLVKISSIFPPRCLLIPRGEGLRSLAPGQILYLVMSENATDEAYRLISASVGVAVPNETSRYGYLAEHHDFGKSEKQSGQHAEDLAAFMLATTLGRPFDLDQIWKEEKSLYRIDEDLWVRTMNITRSAYGKAGLWTTVTAAACCLP